MLNFQEIAKDFRDGNQTIHAVKKTTLQCKRGELIAIVGPSGSGKSTLLTMAGALQTPTSGKIKIDEKDITKLNQKELSNIRMEKIGFILQTSNLVPFLTVTQQFKLLRKHNKKVLDETEFSDLISQLRIGDILNKLPSDISGGQKQRVAIAKALYTNPTIILADEPTASLDTENAMEVMKILKNQSKSRDKVCIIVTHDERLTSFCDRVFEMRDGVLEQYDALLKKEL